MATDIIAQGLAANAQTIATQGTTSIRRGIPISAANRVGGLGGVGATNVTDGTVSGATYRMLHKVPATVGFCDIQFVYGNWNWQATGEVAGANAITVKAYLEYNGTSYPMYFNGAQTVTIQPGVTVTTDILPITLPAGASFWTRTYVTNNGVGSGTWPLGPITNATSASTDTNNYNTAGGDVASSTGNIGSGGAAYSFDAINIIGVPTAATKSVGIVGDSIAAGNSDSGALTIYYGPIERALGQNVPWTRMTRSSYKSAYVGGVYSRSMSLFARGTVSAIIAELGINDIPSQTLASFQALKISEWTMLGARGARIWQTTITPQTTSTDNWTTLANQTIFNTGYNTIRISFNNWLRAGAPIVAGVAVSVGTSGALVAGQTGHPLTGYIEFADAVESARDSGLYAVATNARVVTDAAISASSATLTSAMAAFTNADVGVSVYVAGAGTSGAALSTWILSVTNSTTAVLFSNASTTVSGASLKIGGLTLDGLHPNSAGNLKASAVFTAALPNL